MKIKAMLFICLFISSISLPAINEHNEMEEQEINLSPAEIEARPTVRISSVSILPIVPVSILENMGVATVTATLSFTTPHPVWVYLKFYGTATRPADFVASYDTIFIPANHLTGNITITAVQDLASEFNESIVVDVYKVNAEATELGAQRDTIWILDDDQPLVNLTQSASSLNEGTVNTITATLSHVHTLPVTVPLAIGSASTASSVGVGSDKDFTLSPTSIVIPTGQLKGTASVTIHQDYVVEPNETIIIEMLNPINATENGIQELTSTILNDDILPVLTTGSVLYITGNTASVYGNLTVLGSPSPFEHGICYSKSTQPTISDSKVNIGPASRTGSFSADLTGLKANTTYYARAYAINEVGVSYGNPQKIFVTLDLPQITTQEVSNITATSVVGHANLFNTGSPKATSYGFCWGTSPGVSVYDNKTNNGAATQTTEFSTTINGLLPGTKYYIRAYALNSAGVAYGFERMFTTLKAPTVSTQEVTLITSESAKANGKIDDLGVPNPTSYGFCWSTFSNPKLTNNLTDNGSTSSAHSYSSTITGLNPGTKYYVRAYATNSVGTVYANIVSFTTYKLPTVSTQAVTNIEPTSATGHGKLSDLGIPEPTSYGVCWSLFTNPTINNSKSSGSAINSVGSFNAPITGLLTGNIYYVRAYATNAAGTVYGDEVTFKTSRIPVVTTNSITDITTTTAMCGGNITDLGIPSPTAHGLCWSTSNQPSISDSRSNEGATNVSGKFTSKITGLKPGTTYYVRAYVTNDVGTVYGSVMSFMTLKEAAVTTTQVIDIKEITASVVANIGSVGIPQATAHGVCWSLKSAPTISNTYVNLGAVSSTGAFTVEIDGLLPDTKYYVRAFATSEISTVYGNELSFTTQKSVKVITNDVTDITETSAVANGEILILGNTNPIA